MIRTLVVAGSPLERADLADVVRSDTRLALAGDAHASERGERFRALAPDVVLEARDAAAPAFVRPGDAEMPAVTLVDDLQLAWSRDFARGPRALLPRDASPGEIVAAIVAVAAGLVAYAPRAFADEDRFGRDGLRGDGPGPDDGAGERLTAREADVLRELARGLPNKTIAARLGISDHTVKFHVAAIFAKLGVASRTEAVARGIRLGLVMV